VLDQRRADLGEGLWQALYMCRPSMGANILFPSDRWTTDEMFVPAGIVQAWDCASKSGSANDWSVCCTLGVNNAGRYKVLDIWRAKPDFNSLKQQVFRQWMWAWGRYKVQAGVVIEDANAGTQLIQEIEHLNQVNPSTIFPVAVKPIRNKFVRAEAIAGYQNASQVSLPASAPWRESFIRELEEFPLGQNDDQCDSYVWAQAAFVRSDGVFKPQVGLPEESRVEVYDALADEGGSYAGISPQLDAFDAQMADLKSRWRRLT
jgi:predicted phage terminase large subunit-like protein